MIIKNSPLYEKEIDSLKCGKYLIYKDYGHIKKESREKEKRILMIENKIKNLHKDNTTLKEKSKKKLFKAFE